MMNYLFGILIIVSIISSLLLGRASELTEAVVSSGYSAITLCIELLGNVALWCGLMKIAEKSGLCELISKALSPITNFLFRDLKDKSPKALNAITMNITANLLGLGAAATPMGLEAMSELDKINETPETASDYMTVFAVLNTTSFQILPTTIIMIRQLAGSADPSEIITPILVTSAISVTLAVTTAKLFNRRRIKL